jgi:tripartite-type tricarboxylate transporter receptor subunit TctC
MLHRRAFAALPALLPGRARAFDGGGQPVRIVVPFTPAGQTDILSRLFAQRLAAQWQRPVIVENRPGGNAMIGADAVAKAAPDGTTLLAITLTHAVNASLFPQGPYDFLRDLQTLTLLGSLPLVVVVPESRPWRRLADLAAAARGGAKLNFGSSGTGSPPHLGLELFKRATGARESINHIPYRGGAPSVTDLVAGTLDALISNLPECLTQVQSGRLRALAVTAPVRHRLLPDVPTVAEAGLADLTMTSWTAFQAPAGVPAPLAETLAAAIRQAAGDPVLMEKAGDLGFTLIAADRPASARFVAEEVARYAQLVQDARIRPE